jgi:hypothetical protein
MTDELDQIMTQLEVVRQQKNSKGYVVVFYDDQDVEGIGSFQSLPELKDASQALKNFTAQMDVAIESETVQ